MGEIEVVINITRQEWEYLNKLLKNEDQLGHYERLLVNGKLLPQGHGDLIDRNDLLQKKYWIEEDGLGYEVNIVDAIDVAMADTIVEADKEDE